MNSNSKDLIARWPGPVGYIDAMKSEGFAIPALYCKLLLQTEAQAESIGALYSYYTDLSRNYVSGLFNQKQNDLRVPVAIQSYNDLEYSRDLRRRIRQELELQKCLEIQKFNICEDIWDFQATNLDRHVSKVAEIFGFKQGKTSSLRLKDSFLSKYSYFMPSQGPLEFVFSFDSSFRRPPSSSPLRFYILSSSGDNIYLHDLRSALPTTYEYSIFSWSEMSGSEVTAIHKSAKSATLGLYALIYAFKVLALSIVTTPAP